MDSTCHTFQVKDIHSYIIILRALYLLRGLLLSRNLVLLISLCANNVGPALARAVFGVKRHHTVIPVLFRRFYRIFPLVRYGILGPSFFVHYPAASSLEHLVVSWVLLDTVDTRCAGRGRGLMHTASATSSQYVFMETETGTVFMETEPTFGVFRHAYVLDLVRPTMPI